MSSQDSPEFNPFETLHPALYDRITDFNGTRDSLYDFICLSQVEDGLSRSERDTVAKELALDVGEAFGAMATEILLEYGWGDGRTCIAEVWHEDAIQRIYMLENLTNTSEFIAFERADIDGIIEDTKVDDSDEAMFGTQLAGEYLSDLLGQLIEYDAVLELTRARSTSADMEDHELGRLTIDVPEIFDDTFAVSTIELKTLATRQAAMQLARMLAIQR